MYGREWPQTAPAGKEQGADPAKAKASATQAVDAVQVAKQHGLRVRSLAAGRLKGERSLPAAAHRSF